MGALRLISLFVLFMSIGCNPQEDSLEKNHESSNTYDESAGKGALLLTRFTSLEAFKEVVQVQYADDLSPSSSQTNRIPQVKLTYVSGGRKLTSALKSGISQGDFMRAAKGSTWDRLLLCLKCPYALVNKSNLVSIEKLGRRRPWDFGKGDVAFYDLAEAMVKNIRDEDRINMPTEDLSEKGYLNTFNHITAQAFMTSIFSERLADFVADVHELYNMPELVTGNFTEAQLTDFVNGPVDNYVDMINNEWGQELGKELRKKYQMSSKTHWTPQLLARFLNDVQSYHSWAFQIGFHAFRPTDELVIQFANKINTVLD